MKTLTKLMMLAVLGISSGMDAKAYNGDLLGQTTLNHRTDSDLIYVVGNCPSPRNMPVSAVRLEVHRRAAEIDFIAVQYGNGEWDQLDVRQYFAAGSSSRWIDLRGGARCVEKIKIVGDTEAFFGRGPKALVQVFGNR